MNLQENINTSITRFLISNFKDQKDNSVKRKDSSGVYVERPKLIEHVKKDYPYLSKIFRVLN